MVAAGKKSPGSSPELGHEAQGVGVRGQQDPAVAASLTHSGTVRLSGRTLNFMRADP
jgi:hypothetical protein